jgi:hypothetical protein
MNNTDRTARGIAHWLGTVHATCFLGIAALATTLYIDSAIAGSQASTPGATLPPPIAQLARNGAIPAAAGHPDWRIIKLHRNGAVGEQVAVTVGIPFPPGMLHDARDVRIEDAQGKPIPAHIEPTMSWHFASGGIRAVRAQFRVVLKGDAGTVRFSMGTHTGSAPVSAAKGWPYADGLVASVDGLRMPGVLATLSPQWMSASLIAGPQQPAVPQDPYDHYFATQFEWARALPRENGPAWLFDRPTTLFQQYVRTGRVDYLAAAEQSYRFYMQHIRRFGAPGWPLCGGGFSLGRVNACDPKYVYIQPIKLALALTGDDSEHDAALIRRMVGVWDTGGWNLPAGPYTRQDQIFTERESGLGLLAVVSAWEITGEPSYLADIERRVGWLYQQQKHNPDGLGDDGSWRSSWQAHEGGTYDATTDVRGASPWMTQQIIDALWHAWLVTGDQRIPPMIRDFGQYMEKYGWIKPELLIQPHDWRSPCEGPGGQIAWYWSSAHASAEILTKLQDSEGWYSDAHNVELTLAIAAARYFEHDPHQSAALERRLEKLASSYRTSCATISSTPRRFNWNNRGTGVVQWLMRQPAGSGLRIPATTKPMP